MNPNKPRFSAGDHGCAGGVAWRVRAGRKQPGDLVIEWYIVDRWLPVKLETIFVVLDLICQNEDDLYPHPAEGGMRPIRYINKARMFGHDYATGLLNLERQNRDETDRRPWEKD